MGGWKEAKGVIKWDGNELPEQVIRRLRSGVHEKVWPAQEYIETLEERLRMRMVPMACGHERRFLFSYDEPESGDICVMCAAEGARKERDEARAYAHALLAGIRIANGNVGWPNLSAVWGWSRWLSSLPPALRKAVEMRMEQKI